MKILRSACLWAIGMLCVMHLHAQTLVAEAKDIHQLRLSLIDLNASPDALHISKARNGSFVVGKNLESILKEIAAAEAAGVNQGSNSQNAGQQLPSNDGNENGFGNSQKKAAVQDSVNPVKLAQAKREWYYLDMLLKDAKNNITAADTLDFGQIDTLHENFPDRFHTLDNAVNVVALAPANTGTGVGTASTGIVAGMLPEAAIIEGIVEWTVERAKEELMRAFLQQWLEKLEQDTLLKIAFPKTLDLLATTDLSTIISQGNVWKAAFKQDLDRIPEKLPQIIEVILTKIPENWLSTAQKAEIQGAVNVASSIFAQTQNHKTISEAISLESATIMLDTSAHNTYFERGVVAIQLLISAVQEVTTDGVRIEKPETILNLTPGEMADLWNLLFVRNKREICFAFNIKTEADYAKVIQSIGKVQKALADIASALKTMQELLSVSTSALASSQNASVTLQDVHASFELSIELIETGLDLIETMGIGMDEDEKIKSVLQNIVRPLGEDAIGMIEGISTQQYGMVVTNLVSALRVVSNSFSGDPKLQKALALASTSIELSDSLYKVVKRADSAAIRDLCQNILPQFIHTYDSILGINLDSLFQAKLKQIEQMAQNDLNKAKDKLKEIVSEIRVQIEQWMRAQGFGKEFDEIVTLFNTYGRFMVNVLTAENSDEVKEAFEDAAMKTGSYMVKQTSVSSITVTFLPGYTYGREFMRPNAQFGAGFDVKSQNASYTGATLPIGVEFGIGINSRVIGAAGIFLQAADLGAVLNYRLSTTPDSVGPDSTDLKLSTGVEPEYGFRQVLAPGIGVLLHVAKVPIVFGGRISYTPLLRELNYGGATFQTNMLQVGAFVAVDVTVFQLFASRRKIPRDWASIQTVTQK